jgi:hypothetical protein
MEEQKSSKMNIWNYLDVMQGNTHLDIWGYLCTIDNFLIVNGGR